MLHGLVVPVLADAAATAVALAAWQHVRRLNRVAEEPRLARLATLFMLLGVALALRLLNVATLELRGDVGPRDGSFDALDLLFWLQHAAVLGAIGAGMYALGPSSAGSRAPVMGSLLVGAAPVLLFVEGLGFAFLAFRTGINHIRRSNLGSLQVALGFFLLGAAWLLPLILYPEGVVPLGPPHWLTAVVGLAGVGALAAVLPRRRAPRG